jgi:leucyl aminopeptidase
MQTIISLKEKLLKKENRIVLLSNASIPDTSLFEPKEVKYIKSFYKDHKQDVFSFNRIDHWIFVVIIKKERNLNTSLDSHRTKGAKLTSLANQNKINEVVICGNGQKKEEILAFTEGMALSNYNFLKYKKDPAEKLNSLNQIHVYDESIDQKEIDELNIIVDASNRSRNFVNEPVAYLNAVKFAEEFENLGKLSGLKVEVLTRKKIEALKMGGLLAVNKGSVDPPTFSILEWKPSNAINKKPYVFVGKGVVYDTGGMNIKTGSFMNDMKMDMAGGAAVGGALYAIASARLPVYVIGLIPATDNRVNGNAYVNGDVITMHDGTRVEVINTDAEGRMILADALSYAKKYSPELVIDLATLTGAAARAIGKYGIVAMNSGADKEFNLLKKSGEMVCERLVEFPFWKEYEELIKSEVGDIKNLGGADAGAITAGKFLEHFTDYPYIHLDIAGPAYVEKPYKYNPIGATGVGVRLLFDFIKNKV